MGCNLYTGVGSRETPERVLNRMWHLAVTLADDGYTLRSGAAPGADEWFEKGCDYAGGTKQIFLPWKNFQKNKSPHWKVQQSAVTVAEDVWNKTRSNPFKYLKQPVKMLMGRNSYQVLGKTLDEPSDFVICWTPDGCSTAAERTSKTGGTGQVIALADYHNIPVFNLQRESAMQEFLEFLDTQD